MIIAAAAARTTTTIIVVVVVGGRGVVVVVTNCVSFCMCAHACTIAARGYSTGSRTMMQSGN